MNLKWLDQLDLRHDQETPEVIDAQIRKSVAAAGMNLWVLVFAIVIASVGLNINSTAVIIGAMLISPLMGPIIGIGYGAGINDYRLIKDAFKNLALFVGISLVSATVYFLISPLNEAQSELLARTTPTLWDVLIAFSGGAAGIIAQTRKEISNVVPGVAIATALMPPLCTAGYGIATGNLDFFVGAFYLFSINSVFIALATLLFVKLLKLPSYAYVDTRLQQRATWMITAIVLLTIVPSAYLAYRLVQHERFRSEASRVVDDLIHDDSIILLSHEILPKENRIILTVGGERPSEELTREVQSRFVGARLANASVKVRHAGGQMFARDLLEKEVRETVYENTIKQLEQRTRRIEELEAEVAAFRMDSIARQDLLQEIRAEFPEAEKIFVAQGEQLPSTGSRVLIVHLVLNQGISEIEKRRLKARLETRFEDSQVELVVSLPAK